MRSLWRQGETALGGGSYTAWLLTHARGGLWRYNTGYQESIERVYTGYLVSGAYLRVGVALDGLDGNRPVPARESGPG